MMDLSFCRVGFGHDVVDVGAGVGAGGYRRVPGQRFVSFLRGRGQFEVCLQQDLEEAGEAARVRNGFAEAGLRVTALVPTPSAAQPWF